MTESPHASQRTCGAGSVHPGVESEADLLSRLRPGVDGLILLEDDQRATFLPSVWESLRNPSDFLDALREKAGLPPGYWSPTLRFERYTATDGG